MPPRMVAKDETFSATGQTGPFAGRRVHLIGMGGSGMRALARMLLDSGAHVSGSDMAESAPLKLLRDNGATVCIGQAERNLPEKLDLVVYSAAIHEQNPELIAARQRGVDVLKYSQMLGRMMEARKGIAIAGTHGKSTTSGMVAYALASAGRDPSYIVGAHVDQLGGPSGVGGGELFVAEACEFDRSFLNLRPTHAAILNLEEDHLDCYADLEAIVEAFRAFASGVPAEGSLVVNGEDRDAMSAAEGARCTVETFGLSESCTWRGAGIRADRGLIRMDVSRGADAFCQLQLMLPGRHSAYNALAATALLHHAGLSAEEIAETLSSFTGTRRRMTLVGSAGGATVVDDYAHHPTEIKATLRALRDFYQPRRLICVFQPHQHSRTRFLLKDFALSFGLAEDVIVPDIYFVRDSEREKEHISAEDLVAQIRLTGGAAVYLRTFEDIMTYLAGSLGEGDLLVTMGAGDIWKVADEAVRRS